MAPGLQMEAMVSAQESFTMVEWGVWGTVRGSLLVSAVSGSPYVCLYNKGVFLSAELLAISQLDLEAVRREGWGW